MSESTVPEWEEAEAYRIKKLAESSSQGETTAEDFDSAEKKYDEAMIKRVSPHGVVSGSEDKNADLLGLAREQVEKAYDRPAGKRFKESEIFPVILSDEATKAYIQYLDDKFEAPPITNFDDARAVEKKRKELGDQRQYQEDDEYRKEVREKNWENLFVYMVSDGEILGDGAIIQKSNDYDDFFKGIDGYLSIKTADNKNVLVCFDVTTSEESDWSKKQRMATAIGEKRETYSGKYINLPFSGQSKGKNGEVSDIIPLVITFDKTFDNERVYKVLTQAILLEAAGQKEPGKDFTERVKAVKKIVAEALMGGEDNCQEKIIKSIIEQLQGYAQLILDSPRSQNEKAVKEEDISSLIVYFGKLLN